MHEGAKNGGFAVFLVGSFRVSGDSWGQGTVVLGFQMRSFLVLTSTSPPIKQAGNRAILPFLATNWPHHKAPLRGARVR